MYFLDYNIYEDGPILQYCKCSESIEFQLKIITHLLSHSVLNSDVLDQDIKDDIIHYEEEYLNEADYDRLERSDDDSDDRETTPSPVPRRGRKKKRRRRSSSSSCRMKREKSLTCKLSLILNNKFDNQMIFF